MSSRRKHYTTTIIVRSKIIDFKVHSLKTIPSTKAIIKYNQLRSDLRFSPWKTWVRPCQMPNGVIHYTILGSYTIIFHWIIFMQGKINWHLCLKETVGSRNLEETVGARNFEKSVGLRNNQQTHVCFTWIRSLWPVSFHTEGVPIKAHHKLRTSLPTLSCKNWGETRMHHPLLTKISPERKQMLDNKFLFV
jgi:hypothetical protein